MHVRHPLRPRPLMQVVDILRNNQQFARPFRIQRSQRLMRRIGLYRPKLRPPLVIESVDQLRIAEQRFGRTYILYMMPLPQTIRPAKGGKAALGGNSGARQDNDVANIFHARHEARAKGKFQDMTRIGIYGASGRMGQAIAQALTEAGLTLAGGADRAGVTGQIGGLPIGSDEKALAEASDLLIDFSAPAALEAHLAACLAAGKPAVIGTTGLEPAHHALIDEAAKILPILQTGNTSLGVNLIAALVEDAARRLGPEWDIEILEMHHRHKVDAPSGTALLLGEAAARGRGISLADHKASGRDGITGARRADDIGFAALRGGSVAGDHQVILATEGERIEIGHRAENRQIFARGAVKAAQWLLTQGPGRYDMKGVLGL